MEWVSVIGRTMLLYIIILIIFRLMGKREIGIECIRFSRIHYAW